MEHRRLGVAMNGVTGRMGTNQHLMRSIVPLAEQGGLEVSPTLTVVPEPILVGRNHGKLAALAARVAERTGRVPSISTDLASAIRADSCDVVFDASTTLHRGRSIELAAEAGKPVYCEKPTAVDLDDALRIAQVAGDAGIKNGVVQDKLWLPGMQKLRALIEGGFFGRILSIRGEFGYWVFTGRDADQPAQRPSWNYRAEDGGGIIVDMFCHWAYLLNDLFGAACGPVSRVASWAGTDIPERIDEAQHPYAATADDSAYAMFLLGDRVMAQFNSSWCTRVRRDDLLTIQVDGTDGSAVAGLRECRVQPLAKTPRPIWNPDVPQPLDFRDGWDLVAGEPEYENAFRAQWELFLRHVATGESFPWDLRAGARGVQLAELGLRAWQDRAWLDVPEI